jgi:hypothetical protein
MKIECFENIKTWQLTSEFMPNIVRIDEEAGIFKILWAKETDTRCFPVIYS